MAVPGGRENYWVAHRRLIERLQELLERQRMPAHAVAEHLQITTKTLRHIITRDRDTRSHPRHCPWSLLELLEDAEAVISRDPYALQVQRPNQTMESDLTDEQAMTELAQDELLRSMIIGHGESCWQCSAPWDDLLRLRISTTLPHHYDFQCSICGHTNLSPFPRIERTSSCPHCGAPKHNLTLEEVLPDNHRLRICKMCQNYLIQAPPVRYLNGIKPDED